MAPDVRPLRAEAPPHPGRRPSGQRLWAPTPAAPRQSSPDAIFVTRDARWVFVNDAAVRLFGASRREDLVGAAAADRFREEEAEVQAVVLKNAGYTILRIVPMSLPKPNG